LFLLLLYIPLNNITILCCLLHSLNNQYPLIKNQLFMHSSTTKFVLFILLICCFGSSVLAQSNTCAGATLIVSDSTCKAGSSQLTGTISGATYTLTDIQPSGSPSSACTFVASQDMWYKFVAKSQYPNIALSNLGSNFFSNSTSPTQIGLKMQLFSGTCGSFTEIGCGNNSTPITLTPLNTALIINNFYYIRVHLDKVASATPSGANWGFNICVTDQISKASRMNEIFSRTYLSGANALNYPWEITYGPDDSLWITEARGYKVYKMNSTNGGKRVVLDLSSGSTQFGTSGTGADTLYAQNTSTWINTYPGWPQGGFAGLALHPQFGTGAGKDYVYVTYVWKFISGTNPDGVIYQNKLVRFTYNSGTAKLQSPAVLDWNLPGSTDHNSQRLAIAPVIKGGTNYLFMGSGDMGAGQFTNRYRTNRSQSTTSYEGKILRYNLESDGDAGYNAWLPNDNPYGATNAIWSTGVRNNQGFAYDTATNILYGTSHGPFSDDEINIIEKNKNYGHPLVIGYAADGNYNGTATAGLNTSITAGSAYADNNTGLWYVPGGYTPPGTYTSPYNGKSSLAPIVNEATNATTIGASYKDPLFAAYPCDTIGNIWGRASTPGNGAWESEGWSGLDLYTDKLIPGWKKSLVAAGLKWGRLIKLNLDATGTKTLPSNIGGAVGNAGDTITYFQSSNRYRDIAFAPNGKDIFVVMDNSSATSGPGTANPSAAGCPGCVIKYSFLGYAQDAAGLSTIPKSIPVTTGTLNTCNAGTPITIDATNDSIWVPITGPDGNIMAEIHAMGQSLGLVTSSFYKNSGTIRSSGSVKYLDRNITITPTITGPFALPIKIRLYISKPELDALIAAPSSGVTSVTSLKILKNNDACGASIASSTSPFSAVNPTSADFIHGANGYVLQTAVTGFSSFYFAASSVVLPVDLVTFNGALQSNLSALLNWTTANEINTAGFELERSIDGNNFNKIAFVKGAGNSNSVLDYANTDNDAMDQQSTILYYRLKIMHTNGSFKYSNIVTIYLPATKAIITVAPNPVVNDVKGNILSPISGNATLRIFDNTGRIVLQTTTFIKKGNNSFAQNINQLASGAYYLDISGNGIISRTKFQKL
jgi:trimeric autotransporter adhesin